MQRTTRLSAALAAALFVILLAGCSSGSSTVTLWSDHPDVAALVELFNAEQERYHVTVQYTENAANALVTEQEQPDLVLAAQIANETTFPSFSNLDALYPAPGSAPRLYRSLSALGRTDRGQLLVPVSFDLPAIMFRSGPADSLLPQFAFSLEELREIGALHNEQEGERYTRMGFSPRWDADFLYLTARLEGAGFHEAAARQVRWSRERLAASVELLRDWSTNQNGGINAESAFQERYLYDPAYQLLLRGRVRFWYTSAAEHFSYSDGQRNALGLRWITGDRGVPVLEGIRYLGIPREAENRPGAQAFVKWWLTEETQRQLLRSARRKSLLSFGLLDGFTAFPRVNRQVIPRLYPSLLGMVPAEADLAFPRQKPKEWQQLRNEIVEPWLQREVTGASQEGSLDAQIEDWIRQRGE